SSENVICLTTRRSRDLVLANHSETRGQQSEEGYCVTFSCSVPAAPSVESVPVMVTVPAVPPSDPLVLPDGMLMMAKELEVNVVLDIADIVIALGKLGRGGAEDEMVKLLIGIQRV